ncbi:sensor histidine kinase [Planococcus lenghuensis]|uniref:histidine kinase n=1 Tax=Planococcus lenghuensis TaxID=2213202 RepID=A0A1Q2KYE9_9BACL|nr:HAMP domain-containing sensor histidine kinase [Planococcus lenghuensis]AQQ53238.1 hypothetical protein B0X71_09210 [Planococcus lenghuensis]
MMRASIVAKLVLSILLLVLTILLPLGFTLNQLFASFYFNEAEQELDSLSDRYAASIPSLDSEQLDLFERLSSLTDREIVVVDAAGVVAANSGIPGISEGQSLSAEEVELLSESASQHREYVNPVNGERYLSTGKPIFDGGELLGVVFVLDSAEDLYQSLNAIKQSVILAGAGAVFLALGFAYILSRKLSDPLLDMEKAARKMAKGELDTRVASGTADEIGSLAVAINDLAIDLQQYRNNRRQFFADISHELQTPMTYLEGYAHALENKLYKSEEEQQQYARIIRQETARLSRLVHELFDLAKMEEGKISLTVEDVDLIEVAENALLKSQMKAREKGIHLVFSPPDTVPYVTADGMRMEQVLMNLIDNAVKYTQRGEIRLEVEARAGNVKVAVEDTGIGIPEADLPHLFDRFYRVEKSRSREFGGTGLGLAIVKQLTELQGGTIAVSSKPGEGTHFELTFPEAEEEEG